MIMYMYDIYELLYTHELYKIDLVINFMFS